MLSSLSPVYPDLTRPNMNRILVNLIYFDFIGSRKNEPTIKCTQDETADEILGPTGDQAVGRRQPCRNIQVRTTLRFMISLDRTLFAFHNDKPHLYIIFN
jgi:hypothetical protein